MLKVVSVARPSGRDGCSILKPVPTLINGRLTFHPAEFIKQAFEALSIAFVHLAHSRQLLV